MAAASSSSQSTATDIQLAARDEHVHDWKDVPGFPKYEAAKDGRIRNKETRKVLSPGLNTPGYHQVSLYKDGKSTAFMVHTIIANTWIANPDAKRTVNHKSHDKTDNRVENLEWATHQEQNKHKTYGAYHRKPHDDQNDLDNEEWRDASVAGYKVSNCGRIKNRKGIVLQHNPNTQMQYIEFGVYIDERAKTKGRLSVHREVALAFIGSLTGKVVNHKDGKRHNNNLSNLEVITQGENIKHAYDTGLNKKRIRILLTKPDGAVQTFDSISDASKSTGFKNESIGYASRHGTFLGGFKWERI